MFLVTLFVAREGEGPVTSQKRDLFHLEKVYCIRNGHVIALLVSFTKDLVNKNV